MKRLPSPFYAPRKRFGQHFLEPAWVSKVIDAVDPHPTDDFVEIGPGRGALTLPLLQRVRSLLAVEIDRDLAARLRGIDRRLEIVEGDFVLSAASLATRTTPFRVAGNLPYNAASPILFKLVELRAQGVPLVDAAVMLQREVADRVIARPGSREYGVLSVLVQYSADVRLLLALPPGAFRPSPKVRSALVRLTFREPTLPAADPHLFNALVRAIFTRRRKTLTNALMAFNERQLPPLVVLRRAGIDGRRRPESLAVEEFVRLANSYMSASADRAEASAPS